MKYNITVEPNELKQETCIQIQSEDYLPFAGAYVGVGTYCCGLEVDNGIEFQNLEEGFLYNLQIGRYNSIAEDSSIMIGRTHNTRAVESGALSLFFKQKNCEPLWKPLNFIQKGSIVIQNDVYIGNQVRIMPNVVIRNGAVIAANSHVVSNVPPYAIVGGNPAKIIGYRFPKEIIEKLQIIRWWDWDESKLLENSKYFTEDLDEFCDRFFDEENQKFITFLNNKSVQYPEDTYFAFVDFYENYANYIYIWESFLDAFSHDETKRLIFFVQADSNIHISDEVWNNMREIIDKINRSSDIKCKVDIKCGNLEEAENVFAQCHHYLISRTFWAVHFSCLADLLNIEILSGVDRRLYFSKKKNMTPQ